MEAIGKYQVVRLLGEGGMGQVYEATDPIIGRRVAIKTISGAIFNDADARNRFFREARAAGQLSHPNLITIYDIAEQGGRPYIVMEYLDGADLGRATKGKDLTLDAKLQIMIEICQGLAHAHAGGVIHRDVKPANIFMTADGRVKILDFGLARGALSELTQTGQVVGTPNYMAPEQIRGDAFDHRADIFAAGAVFYELLVRRKAFEGESVAATIYKVLDAQPTPVDHVDLTLPPSISAIVTRALAKSSHDRYQSIDEMLADIRRARTAAAAPLLPSTPGRRRLYVGAAVAAVLLVVAVGAIRMFPRKTPAPAATPIATQTAAAPVVSPPPTAVPAEAPIATAPSEPPRVEPGVGAGRGKSAEPRGAASPARTPPRTPPASVSSPAAGARPTTPAPEKARPVEPPAAEPPRAAVVEAPHPPPPRTVEATTPVSPIGTTALPPPPMVASPPAPMQSPDPTAGIHATLTRYTNALEARDLGALRRIWPSLSGRQEEAIRNEFQNARAIAVELADIDVKIVGRAATATCRRRYTVTTAQGQTLNTVGRMIVALSRQADVWTIDNIRYEATR